MRTVLGSTITLALLAASCTTDDGEAADTGDGSGTSAPESTAPDASGSPGSATTVDDASSTTGSEGSTTAPTDEGSGTDESGTSEDIETWELRAGGFMPPQQETSYSCFSFSFPVEQLHHIVGFAPVVESPIVHHYVLSLADGPTEIDPNDPCVEWPAHILWAWAPGVESIELPPDAGFLVGHQGDSVNFILQVHYNNPLMMPIVDEGGVDVQVTKALRPNRAGIFTQGDVFSISIPPEDPSYEHVATCISSATSQLLPHPIHVFASFLHAHQLGAAMWTSVSRDGTEIGEIARDDPFSFDTQRFQATDFDVMPGDEMATHCVYDSTGVTSHTQGGEASNEEMCLNFLMYYPWMPSEICGL